MDANNIFQPNDDDIDFLHNLVKQFEKETNIQKEGIIFLIETLNYALLQIENLKHDPEVGKALLELDPDNVIIIVANGYFEVPIHVNEIIDCFVELCLNQLGGLALYTINKWNIYTTKDIGRCLESFLKSNQFIKYNYPEKIVSRFENKIDLNDVLDMEKYVSSLPVL